MNIHDTHGLSLEVCNLIETARIVRPYLPDDVMISLTLAPFLSCDPVQNDGDLLLTMVVRSVVCTADNSIQQLQVVGPKL